MSKILKYKLNLVESQTVSLPAGWKFLTIKFQNGLPSLWILDENSSVEDTEEATFVMHVTGKEFDSTGLSYLKTVKRGSGIYHFFLKY